jgi:small subunit ribosomal protein S8
MNHPIIDLIIRLKNGYGAQRQEVESPHSNFREEVLKKLVEIGYVKKYTVTGDKVKTLHITLQYDEAYSPALTDVKIYSKPGRRWYVAMKELKPVLGGLGYSILSTPKGILTHVEAKKNKVGGELLFSIW